MKMIAVINLLLRIHLLVPSSWRRICRSAVMRCTP